jgi:glycosyltransferase involved in cell wall biosynthesis
MKEYILVSQFFPPDPTAVGQQAYDLAYHISKRKVNITVLTSNSNYNNIQIKHSSQKKNKNFFLKRFPYSNFGKNNMFNRVIGQIFFIIQCFYYLKTITKKNFTLVLTTSPSISSVLGFALHFLNKKLKIIYWVSDINPDQSIRLNIFKKNNILVKILMFFEKQLLRRSFKIITLDKYMKANLNKKIFSNNSNIAVVPPWCHEENLKNIKVSKNYFIKKYNLNNKFVIIYSGNHSIANPLITFFKAAKILKKIEKIQFIFIGEGNIKNELIKYKELNKLDNILMLPYVSLNQLKYVLSAANLNLVSTGNSMKGIIHTSKHYNFLKIGKPFLYLGPKNSSIGNFIEKNKIGWQVNHNDINQCSNIIKKIFFLNKNKIDEIRIKTLKIYNKSYKKEKLINNLINSIIESK